MIKTLRALWFLPVLSLVLGACGGDSSAETRAVLRFSAIPDHDETLLRQKYDPVAKYLAEQLDVEVEYVPATSYDDARELFENGDVQLAWFGGLTGVQVHASVAGSRAIAQGMSDPQFYSYFVAHKDSGVEPSADFPMTLKGKTFTFGSRNSTSGRLMPEYFIRTMGGAAPAEFFGQEPGFSDAHDKTAKEVESGAYQAGALNYKTYDRMVADGQLDPAVCRVVWRTPTYADYNFTAHPLLETRYGAGFTDKVQSVLLAMGPEVTKAFDREKFIAASNDDFAKIAKLAKELGFLRP